MMDPDENGAEELEAVPSGMFDSSNLSPAASGLGWAGAAAAGTALFAGVSSRVEGVSSRMSLRAKDMLALSAGDDHGPSGNGSPVSNAGSPGGSQRASTSPAGNGSTGMFNSSSSASGILSGIADVAAATPTPADETEVSRLVSSLSSSPQLAEKVVAMSKLSSLLGDGAGKSSQNVLHSVAGPLVAVLHDAEHFDPFFANACIACAQQLLGAQGKAFAKELVEAGTPKALIPLLHPRFELIRIEGLALLEALLVADRGSVCAQVVGVPTGMQALVDLLDDRWDEVRHQAVSLLATFLTEDGGVPPPVDLQNFVAFQDGFDKLFKAVGEPSEDVSLRALAALAGALAENPLSRKLLVSGGHLPRLPALLRVLKPEDISERPLVQRQKTTTATTARRRWGWGGGGGRDKKQGAAAAVNGGKGGVDGAPPGPASPSSGGGGEQASGAEGPGGWSGEVPVGRIRAALSLVSALVGCCREETGTTATAGTGAAPGVAIGDKHGFVVAGSGAAGGDQAAAAAAAAADGVRAAVGKEGGLLEAVCELALASTRAPAGGGATWAQYGLPEDCQRSALGILTSLVSGHPGNQALFTRCSVRGAPMAVTVHGQKQFVSAEPRNVVDVLLELWLAASSSRDGVAAGGGDAKNDGKGMDVTTEVALLDKALGAFLVGNTTWCKAVLAGVSSMHAAAATGTLGDGPAKSARSAADTSESNQPGATHSSSSGRSGNGDGKGAALEQNGDRSNGSTVGSVDGHALVGGVTAMSSALKRGLLCVRSTSSSGPTSNGGGGGGGGADGTTGSEEDDDPLGAALCLRLLRMVLQAGHGDARALAAGIGMPTVGARRREEGGIQGRLGPAAQEGGDGNGQEGVSSGELRNPSARVRGSEDGNRDGGMRDRGGGGGRGGGRGSVRYGPPLTPALEVAMRLLADGYGVAVMLQTGGSQGGDEDCASPPSDLSHYLVSLGELLVTWLSPQGVGPALSQRLLAGGSSWALLLAIGRAICPDMARKNNPPEKRRHSQEHGGDAAAASGGTGAASALSEDPALAYLHAVVAVVIGSLLSSDEGSLASETLAVGVRAHVGVFEFCRALDAASDWVAFAWPAAACTSSVPEISARDTGCRNPVPAVWALAGDCTFSAGVVEIVQAAQKAMIRHIDAGAASARPPSTSPGGGEEGVGSDSAGDGGRREVCEQLLRRQQARIEELERRLVLPAAATGAGAHVDHVCDAVEIAAESSQRPTLTI